MKYFVTDDQRESTAYHEFYKGKWDKETFWSKDSIDLYDDELVNHKGFYNALYQAVPGYDPYEMVEVSAESWKAVRECIPEDDTESIELYEEADAWAKDVLKEHGCFTILGL